MTKYEHNRLLAGFFFISGALRAFAWVVMGGAFGGEFVTIIVAAFLMFTGWKIHNDQPGLAPFGIAASVILLSSFPIGTALGVYGLWFFLKRSKEEI